MAIFAATIFLVVLGCLLLIGAVVCWFYGIVLSLRASILLFIICFFFHVPFVIFGLVKIVAGVDIPAKICAVLKD